MYGAGSWEYPRHVVFKNFPAFLKAGFSSCHIEPPYRFIIFQFPTGIIHLNPFLQNTTAGDIILRYDFIDEISLYNYCFRTLSFKSDEYEKLPCFSMMLIASNPKQHRRNPYSIFIGNALESAFSIQIGFGNHNLKLWWVFKLWHKNPLKLLLVINLVYLRDIISKAFRPYFLYAVLYGHVKYRRYSRLSGWCKFSLFRQPSFIHDVQPPHRPVPSSGLWKSIFWWLQMLPGTGLLKGRYRLEIGFSDG